MVYFTTEFNCSVELLHRDGQLTQDTCRPFHTFTIQEQPRASARIATPWIKPARQPHTHHAPQAVRTGPPAIQSPRPSLCSGYLMPIQISNVKSIEVVVV